LGIRSRGRRPDPDLSMVTADLAGSANEFILVERSKALSLTHSNRSNLSGTGPMNILAIDRALSIYGVLADRSETKGARKRLSEHLMKKCIAGEKNEHRLTVEALSYLHNLDRENDSRN
jgi:hypothetical protein